MGLETSILGLETPIEDRRGTRDALLVNPYDIDTTAEAGRTLAHSRSLPVKYESRGILITAVPVGSIRWWTLPTEC